MLAEMSFETSEIFLRQAARDQKADIDEMRPERSRRLGNKIHHQIIVNTAPHTSSCSANPPPQIRYAPTRHR